MKDLLLSTEPVSTHLELVPELSLAKEEINIAWERYKLSTIKRFKDGLEFGRTCHEWQLQHKAQGSRTGKGFEHVLEQLAIPKTTAYRWVRRYAMNEALRAKRNEVKNSNLNLHIKSQSNVDALEKRTSFGFLLTDEQRQRFERDVKTLGGRQRVGEIFFDFVSQKASEKRVADKLSSLQSGHMTVAGVRSSGAVREGPDSLANQFRRLPA
jgi:hypothetical protein